VAGSLDGDEGEVARRGDRVVGSVACHLVIDMPRRPVLELLKSEGHRHRSGPILSAGEPVTRQVRIR
jgi:hypothetical protein